VTFDVPAEAYRKFMGRFSEPLAPLFAEAAGVAAGQRVLDVGCGPGALTAVLVERLGAGQVSAVDPSQPFVDAVRTRLPGVDVRRSGAESLPYDDDTFDAATAQLVVHFMSDPVAGLREMARVTRPGGAVAATVWDYAGGTGPLTTFWAAVRDLDPGNEGESRLAGARQGHLVALREEAGVPGAVESRLAVSSRFAGVDEWWEPYTHGVGPAGTYVAGLEPDARDRLRAHCAELLPEPPFEVHAVAWCAVGRVE
jgi:SAM-dependent methyltransferase